MSGDSAEAAGFAPPPYPYDRLSELRERAEHRYGPGLGSGLVPDLGSGLVPDLGSGLVDCSIGTPCDPPPADVLTAMAASNTERGYPPSAGSAAYRMAAAGWLERRFGVSVDATTELSACVGTKEFVASSAHFLRLRTPSRDTVLYPSIAYPTYAMGARLAGCRAVPVPMADDGGLDIGAIRPEDAARALLLWVNAPSNPTGCLTDLGAAARWGRGVGVPVFSDECYAEFTWSRAPQSILQHGSDGVIAVHSLSKRSNLAGARAGFFAGDEGLVGFLEDVRRHAGLMVPGPVQAGGAAAFADDDHVMTQRQRYRERLDFLAGVLGDVGVPAPSPDGGFYLWVPVPPDLDPQPTGPDRAADGWALAARLAVDGGLLVSPGEFYGPSGAGFVRAAVVQPMDRLRLVAERLAAHGPLVA